MPTTFDYTGSQQTYDVPSDVSEVIIECWGAQGTASGGYAKDTISVSGGETLYVNVGGDGPSGGWNGGVGWEDGSPSDTPKSGGASDVRQGGTTLSDRVVVGGGGGSEPPEESDGGGAGGGFQGEPGEDADGWAGGEGGTQTSGGAAPGGGYGSESGSFGEGGRGSDTTVGGGNGGGGWYGGGGGNVRGGGGGGSSYGATTQTGVQSGHGQVTITPVQPLDASQNVNVDAERESEIDVSGDAVTNAEEYRLYRHDEPGPYTNGSHVATIDDDGSSSYAYTDTGLTNGRQYHYQVVAAAPGDDAHLPSDPSSEATGTTLCPSPVLDATDPYDDRVVIQLDLAVQDDNPDGSLDIYRSTDGSLGSVISSITDLSADSYADDTVQSGETYFYTLGRDTGDVTAYSSQVEETATFRPVVNLVADAVGETSVGLSWEHESTWSGTTEVWRIREGYEYDGLGSGYDELLGERIAELGDGILPYTDDTVQPNTEYTYRVRGVDDVEGVASTAPVTVTTAGPDLPKTRTRSAEWTVEIRLDDRTLNPPAVGEPDVRPRANDLPEIRIPTTEGPWTRLDLEGGAEDLLIWHDGVRQPIEALERVEEADDGHVLVGRGGTSLLDRVQVEVDQQPVHDLAQELIEDHTPYSAVVDAPPESLSEEILFDVTTASAWSNLFANTDLSRIPVEVDDTTDSLAVQQSNWVREGEGYDAVFGNPAPPDGSNFSGGGITAGEGQALRFTELGDAAEYEIETGYTIPETALAFQHRIQGGGGLEITISIDGDVVAVLPQIYDQSSVFWTPPDDVSWSGDLEAGEHTVRYEVTAEGSDTTAFDIDVFSLYDDRYEYDFDDDLSENADGDLYLDGPQPCPELTIETDAEALVLSAVGADLTTRWNDTSNGQAIEVSNDGGATWPPDDGSESNTESISVEFDEPGAQLQARLTLGRYGSRDETPATGFEGQRVSSLELTATLDDTPLAVNQAWDTSLRDVLRDLAEQAGGLWDVEYDDGVQINWTYPGVREATVTEPLTTYDVATDVREAAARVVVLGGNAHQVGDRVDANHGSSVSLQQPNLVTGRESVYDPEGGTSYQRDDDYEIDYDDGAITTLQAGDVADGQTIAVDYDYETRGSFESDEANTNRTITRNITGLVSDRQCAIAARRISLQLREPLHEADVGFTPGPASWSIADQLTVDGLPFEGPYSVKETRTQDGTLRARLGSRQSVEEIVSEIQDNADRVARRV